MVHIATSGTSWLTVAIRIRLPRNPTALRNIRAAVIDFPPLAPLFVGDDLQPYHSMKSKGGRARSTITRRQRAELGIMRESGRYRCNRCHGRISLTAY